MSSFFLPYRSLRVTQRGSPPTLQVFDRLKTGFSYAVHCSFTDQSAIVRLRGDAEHIRITGS